MHVAVEGAAGAEDALELQAGVDVGVLAVAVGREVAGVEGLEARGQDDGAHLQGELSRPAARSRWPRPGRPGRRRRSRR